MSLSMCSKLVCLIYVYSTLIGKVESHLNLCRIVPGTKKVIFDVQNCPKTIQVHVFIYKIYNYHVKLNLESV